MIGWQVHLRKARQAFVVLSPFEKSSKERGTRWLVMSEGIKARATRHENSDRPVCPRIFRMQNHSS
jgi:hypothetical protein